MPGLFKIALKWDWFSSVFESLALNRLIFDHSLIAGTVLCLKLMACGKYLSILIEEADESVMNVAVQTVWTPQTFLNINQLQVAREPVRRPSCECQEDSKQYSSREGKNFLCFRFYTLCYKSVDMFSETDFRKAVTEVSFDMEKERKSVKLKKEQKGLSC